MIQIYLYILLLIEIFIEWFEAWDIYIYLSNNHNGMFNTYLVYTELNKSKLYEKLIEVKFGKELFNPSGAN